MKRLNFLSINRKIVIAGTIKVSILSLIFAFLASGCTHLSELEDQAQSFYDDLNKDYDGPHEEYVEASKLIYALLGAAAILGVAQMTAEIIADNTPELSRDPFAMPGQTGNRGIQYGSDGPIPDAYREKIDQGILLAYKLSFDQQFNEIFRDTVSKLSGIEVSKDAYINALDKMKINHAESSVSDLVQKELLEIKNAKKIDFSYKEPPAFSEVNGNNIWLQNNLLKTGGPEAIASAIMHEAAHLAGAPGNLLAEMALERLHQASGYSR